MLYTICCILYTVYLCTVYLYYTILYYTIPYHTIPYCTILAVALVRGAAAAAGTIVYYNII